MASEDVKHQVTVKILIDGKPDRELTTESMMLIDDKGTFSYGIKGLTGVATYIQEAVHHFSKAVIGIENDTPFDIEKAKMLQLFESRLMVACLCSAMYSFGETHDLQEFRDMADKLNTMFGAQINEIDPYREYDTED